MAEEELLVLPVEMVLVKVALALVAMLELTEQMVAVVDQVMITITKLIVVVATMVKIHVEADMKIITVVHVILKLECAKADMNHTHMEAEVDQFVQLVIMENMALHMIQLKM